MSDGLRLVGLEELSATTLRDRLLARRSEFWAGAALDDATVLALHDPLFFHQLGGFGAVARTSDGDDAGYLLGLVGVARRLVERFLGLAASTGARAAQAVAVPGDAAVLALGQLFGASPTPSPGHAGPGADRVLLTCRLPPS